MPQHQIKNYASENPCGDSTRVVLLRLSDVGPFGTLPLHYSAVGYVTPANFFLLLPEVLGCTGEIS
jgi:hypothetical protein